MANQAAKTETTKLFDSLYAAGKEVFDAARKPLAERQLKRKFQTAYDNAATSKLEAELSIQKSQEDLSTYDLSKIIELKERIKNYEYTMDAIAEHYTEMFGDSLVK